MLENIKSTYFSKMIFTWINEKRKLNTIKYNKNLQEKMNITLLNYKIFYGKYIIFEDKEKGKEYNVFNDKLIFEGEYSNGKRNGKGKEYDNYGRLIFKGEYLNGKGKEYDNYGYLIFEGEYLNGKRNGKGKEYYKRGILKFEGEYSNGKKWNGKGYNIIVIFLYHIYNI